MKTVHIETGIGYTMRHRAITAVCLFSAYYVLENHFHFEIVAKGVEIAIFPYVDALLKQLGGIE